MPARIRLQTCLSHQWAWIVIAILINLYSYLRITLGQSPVTTTDPITGICLFLLYCPGMLLGHWGKKWPYQILTAGFILLIVSGGILKHAVVIFSPDGLSAYASTFWWLTAILINVYGTIASLLSMWTLGHTDTPTQY